VGAPGDSTAAGKQERVAISFAAGTAAGIRLQEVMMSPVWMIEGGAAAPADGEATNHHGLSWAVTADGSARGDSAERRLAALAAAIRDHESRRRHQAVPARPEDLALYRRLRQVCGGV
jgi:hypothetical protein